ncbi:coiled-coil domain-containing protein [Vibrio metschnikovii]|uniref:hypothetical protein n=1 Tax=Vibrio metschnikovii TaxID=28172 RepID=UPI0013024069|nr:hypothetical protein [Vibrio metschnikovii]
MKIIASMIESAQWQAWLSQQHSPFPIITNSKKPCTDEVTIIATPCSLAEIDSDLLDYDELVIHVWGLQATLANALRNGAEETQIDSVVAKWVETSEQLLAWLPKHQHKVNVLSHAHATYFTQDWCEWLNNLGIEWPQADVNTTCARTSQDEYDLFAAYYVKTHPQLERLDQLLLSVALPMGEDYPQLPLSIAELTRQSQHAIRRQRYTDKQLAERESDIDQLRQERAAEQMKFDQQLAENQQTHDVAISAAAQQKIALEEQLKATEQQQQALAQENELVITELHRVQEALEASLQQNLTLEQQLVTAVQQRQEVEQEYELVIVELHRVQESLEASLQQNQQAAYDYKVLDQQVITNKAQYAQLERVLSQTQAQLDRIKHQYTDSQRALEQEIKQTLEYQLVLEQENSALIDELQKTQEIFERTYIERNELQHVVSQLEYDKQQQTQSIKNHNAKIVSLNKRYHLTKLELAQALAGKSLLEKELNAHHRSVLWQISVPMRKIRRTSKRKFEEKLAQQKSLIEFSEYFDEQWYIENYPDVKESSLPPIEHYLRLGSDKGYNPSNKFNTQWYLKTYPDVAESGINPLVHYLCFGAYEERKTMPPLMLQNLI